MSPGRGFRTTSSDDKSVLRVVSVTRRPLTGFESGDGATDASDEVGAGIAEGIGDDASGGEVIAASDRGKLFDEAVTVGIALAGISVGDVDTPLMVRLVGVLRGLVCGAV